MKYRRATTAGASYFFTVNLADRRQSLLTENIEILRTATRNVRQNHPFHVDAMVVLPDHLHTIWTLPEGDAKYSQRWALIKAGFSRQLPKNEPISSSRVAKRERGIWQRRYWEHQIRDTKDFERHVDYIHFNPVKHGYVSCPTQWRFSSIHRYVKKGMLPVDWAGEEDDRGLYGE